MANTKLQTQTPGAAPLEKQMPPQAEQGAPDPNARTLQEQFEALPPELKEYVEALKAKAVKDYRRSAMQKKDDSDLPSAKDVDATKIKRAVQTREGWVVPTPPPEEPGRSLR